MSYIKSSLGSNEQIRYLFQLNKYTLMTPLLIIGFAIAILGFGIFFGGGIPWEVYIGVSSIIFLSGLIMYFRLKSIEYGVTDNRVIAKTGIIARNTEEILNKAVETIEVKQDIMGRIFGYGDVIVTGRGNAIVQFSGIDEPLKVKREIEECVYD